MAFFLYSFILLATVIILYYVRYKRSHSKHFSNRNIPHLPPAFLIGNAIRVNFKTSLGEFLADLYQKHKEKSLLGYWIFNVPSLVVFDLDLIQKILVSDFSHFHDRMVFPGAEGEPLTDHLFHLSGQEWRNMRVKLTPTFTSGKMKMMYPIMTNIGNELKQFLSPFAKQEEEIEIKDVLARFTMDIIASCAFGIDTNSIKNPTCEFRFYAKRLFNPTRFEMILQQLSFLFPWLRKIFGVTLVPKDAADFFINAVDQTMKYRTLNDVRRNDFMQLLIQLKEKGVIEDVDKSEKEYLQDGEKVTDTKFTLLEAAAQAFVFFIAGFETSSATMAFTVYELSKNQDIQKKLKGAIKECINKDGSPLSYEQINKLEYLDWIILETLRKYPVVPLLMRQATKDYYVPNINVTIPKGQFLMIPLLGITRDPEIFKDPEKFDPSRFAPEEVAKRHHFSSIPFGEGPRICIGNRFGLLQTKVGLVSLLEKYTVKPSKNTPEVLEYDPKGFLMTLKDGMPVTLVED